MGAFVNKIASSSTYPVPGTSEVYYRFGNTADPYVSLTGWTVNMLYLGANANYVANM